MARRELTRPRRPIPPAGLTKRTLTDATSGNKTYLRAGFIHVTAAGVRHVWGCGNAVLYRATDQDGTTWAGTRMYNFNTNFTASGIEGLFISSGGDIFVTAGAPNLVVVAVNKATATTAFGNGDFVKLRCNDGFTEFVPNVDLGDNGAESGFSPNQWSFWEIEHSHEATGGLAIGDIVMSSYQRATTVRAAFIYVLRKIDNVWHINADSSTMLPSTDDNLLTCGDPFTAWNRRNARVCRHIHHITFDDEGVLNFSTGDSPFSLSIASSEEDSGQIRIVTTAPHYLTTGCFVRIAGHDAVDANGDWQITYSSATKFILQGSLYAAPGGAAGTALIGLGLSDFGSYYRLWRLAPDNTGATEPEYLTSQDTGYTAMTLLDDGYILMGNDSATQGGGTLMDIDLWQHGRFVKQIYTSGDASFDWPIFELIQAGNKIYAAVQRNNSGGASTPTYPASCGGLLVANKTADPRDLRFKTLIQSTHRVVNGPGYIDVDRIFAGRRRQVPSGAGKLIFTVQPLENIHGVFYTLDL